MGLMFFGEHQRVRCNPGYLEKGIQTPVAQGRSTKIISMIMWAWTGRLSIKISLSV